MSRALSVPISTDMVAQEAPSVPTRLDYLDGLRALAALYVVLNHALDTIWPPEYHKYPTGALAAFIGWLGYGHFAVTAFIVISGFCLMLPVMRSGKLAVPMFRFLKKRARRILPPYYFALGISALLDVTIISSRTGTHWDITLPATMPALIAHVLLLQDLVYSVSINHAMWSIATEWHIYFLFPALVAFWRRAGAVTATLMTLAISYAVYFDFKHLNVIPPDGASAIVPQYVGLFALGMAGATLAFEPSARIQPLFRRIPWLLLAICAIAVVCMLNGGYGTLDGAYSDIFVGIAMVCALVGASRMRQGLLRRLLSWRPLVFVGTMSYSLYLIHAPLLQIFWQYVLYPWHLPDGVAFAALVLGTSLIVALAHLFFLICERPFLASPPPIHPWIVRLAALIPVSRLDFSSIMTAGLKGDWARWGE